MYIPPLFDTDRARAVVGDITWAVFRLAPPGWTHVRLDFREVGLYHEARAQVDLADGSRVDWEVPYDVRTQLDFLRLGMRFASGTWHSCVVEVGFPAPSDPKIEREFTFDWDGEPEFDGVCPVAEYRREIDEVYADADSVQTWLLTRAALPDNPLGRHPWFATQEGEEPALCGGRDAGPGDDDVPEDVRDALLTGLREGWASVQYRVEALGSAQEHFILGFMPDGVSFGSAASEDLVRAVTAARRAEYRPDRGAWFRFQAELGADGSASAHRDYEHEPDWKVPVSGEEYEIELRDFPRPDYAIPEWLRSHVEDAPGKPPHWAPGLRQADTFDTFETADRRYLVDRPGLDPAEAAKVLAYLKAGALALTARTVVRDEIFRDAAPAVPLGFQTDGSWIWPQAAVYYLERHQMPPQTALLEHIRAAGYVLPGTIGEDAVTAAREQLCPWIEGRVAP